MGKAVKVIVSFLLGVALGASMVLFVGYLVNDEDGD